MLKQLSLLPVDTKLNRTQYYQSAPYPARTMGVLGQEMQELIHSALRTFEDRLLVPLVAQSFLCNWLKRIVNSYSKNGCSAIPQTHTHKPYISHHYANYYFGFQLPSGTTGQFSSLFQKLWYTLILACSQLLHSL